MLAGVCRAGRTLRLASDVSGSSELGGVAGSEDATAAIDLSAGGGQPSETLTDDLIFDEGDDVGSKEAGMATAEMRVARRLPRKRSRTSTTRTAPSRISSRACAALGSGLSSAGREVTVRLSDRLTAELVLIDPEVADRDALLRLYGSIFARAGIEAATCD